MFAVVTSSKKRQRDAVDIEFDAIYRKEQEERGIRYNGLYLVGKEPQSIVPPPPPAVAKRGFRDILKDIVFGEEKPVV